MDPILEEEGTELKFEMISADDVEKLFPPIEQKEIPDKLSLWVKDKDIYTPSTNITLLTELNPGFYTVHFSRELGLYCKVSEPISDELFTFSDSEADKLLKEIRTFWDKSDLYKENELIHKRGILLEGYPGVGKSSLISILSKEIISKGGIVFKAPDPRNLYQYIDFITQGFRKIQPDTPIITVMESIEQYAGEDLLDFLDGKSSINHHIVIATSNNLEDIPDTVLRPSRIDLRLEVKLPCEKTREEYFKFKNVPEKDIDVLVNKTNGFSLADLKETYVCIYLLDYSIDDAINKVSEPSEKNNYLDRSPRSSEMAI